MTIYSILARSVKVNISTINTNSIISINFKNKNIFCFFLFVLFYL